MTKPVNTISGLNNAPRLNRHVGSTSRCNSQDTVVTRSRISSGLTDTESVRYRIDSRLDRFFVNGHQDVVTMSPISVSDTMA